MKLSLFRRTFPLLFLLFAPPIHAQTQRQANENRESTSSISGRVTIDGKPAVNALVSLREFNRDGGDGKKGASGGADGQRFFAKVRTDNDGRYRFMRLAEGAYSIHVLSHAYASKETCKFGANCREAPLVDGEALENVNFTFVRGGVITGRVTDVEDRPVIAAGMLLLQVNEKSEDFGRRSAARLAIEGLRVAHRSFRKIRRNSIFSIQRRLYMGRRIRAFPDGRIVAWRNRV
jgi:hypothetical protein